MVKLALEALRADPSEFETYHIDARFSETLEEIGESSLGKLTRIYVYLYHAVVLRLRIGDALLYYVPGPVKWSAVLRDWLTLLFLRGIYRRVIFHWHAIGQGEWAHGSDRLRLSGPAWIDHLARRISARILQSPYASISVCESSTKDAFAVDSRQIRIVPNGLVDPCPDFDRELARMRISRLEDISRQDQPCFRVLFLSYGTEEKGLMDAVESLRVALERGDASWGIEATFVGGVSESLQARFGQATSDLQARWPNRLRIRKEGYLSGQDKHRQYVANDVFLCPSRWESFGLTVVEAMAHGLEIVAAASDGVQGVLPEGHPYIAPINNPEKLGESLISCFRNLSMGSSISHSSIRMRERFLNFFQIEKFDYNLKDAIRYFSPLSTAYLGVSTAIRGDQHSLTSANQGVMAPKPLPHDTWKCCIGVYLADQNPGFDRSFGISRMSRIVLEALIRSERYRIATISSQTSQQAPDGVDMARILPWGTRSKLVRFLTDHLHPLFIRPDPDPDLYYFPKGYLPMLDMFCRPSVVTIHDTIIQYDEDHYPEWRAPWEYGYWAGVLKHTLRNANRIMTVSEFSKRQITAFMLRHGIPEKEITVTYEPCAYESIPQPDAPEKSNKVIHLASIEPHKRTAQLILWWLEAEAEGRKLPELHLIGSVPAEVISKLNESCTIRLLPFMEDARLQAAYSSARALVLPSEIEGFGLPALEAYYLGTPVCFVKGTSVEEILAGVTGKGAFSLESRESFFSALDEVMAMDTTEIRRCGLMLREAFDSTKVAERIEAVFQEVKDLSSASYQNAQTHLID